MSYDWIVLQSSDGYSPSQNSRDITPNFDTVNLTGIEIEFKYNGYPNEYFLAFEDSRSGVASYLGTFVQDYLNINIFNNYYKLYDNVNSGSTVKLKLNILKQKLITLQFNEIDKEFTINLEFDYSKLLFSSVYIFSSYTYYSIKLTSSVPWPDSTLSTYFGERPVYSKSNSENYRSFFQNLYETTLFKCRPISTGSEELQTAIANYVTDQSAINSLASRIPLNETDMEDLAGYTERYKSGIAALFLQVRLDQIAFADKYIKLYNKYNTFKSNSAIASYGASLADIPVTIPDVTSDRQQINDLDTSISSTDQPTSAQIQLLQNFCNTYGGETGYYANLVNHVRTNLANFIVKYDEKWNSLSTTLKAGYTYTTPLVSNAIPTTKTDVDLYNYMNEYAGFPSDSLIPTGSASAPISYTSRVTTVGTREDALAKVNDFGNMYTALSSILSAKSDSRLTAITTLIENASTPNTITYVTTNINTDTVTKLDNAISIVGSTEFSTTTTNLVNLARDNLNVLLKEYSDVRNAYNTFRTAFSGKSELSTLPELSGAVLPVPTWSSANATPMPTLTYSPASGTYTQRDISGIMLYGTLTNYPTYAGYVQTYISKFQTLVNTIQTNVNEFRTSTISRISDLPTVTVNSASADLYSSSLSKSSTTRNEIISMSNSLLTYFMKLYLVHTWIPGRRYLSDANLTAVMTSFSAKCLTYIDATGSVIISPLTLTGTDTSQSIMSSAETALRDISKGLATSYDSAWKTWVVGRQITKTATLPGTISTDVNAGTNVVRAQYLGLWTTLIGDIRSATVTIVNLNDWYRGTGIKVVKGTQTTGLGQ